MEAVSGSVFRSHSLPSSRMVCPRTPVRRGAVVREGLSESNGVNRFNRSYVVSLSREISDDGDDDKDKQNGFPLLSEKSLSMFLFQDNLVHEPKNNLCTGQSSVIHASFTTILPSGGLHAGLFRTPISGGVQSATSAHGLPRPALAVRNLMEQIPGWRYLSNARVTIFSDVFPLPEEQREWAHKQYILKHQQGPSQQWGNFYYFRMENIRDIYFIGGFGTVAWVYVNEYENVQPDIIAVDGGEHNLKQLLSTESEIDDAAIISIDSKGIDIRVREGAQFNIQRLSFLDGHAVETLDEANDALWKLINNDQVNMQK